MVLSAVCLFLSKNGKVGFVGCDKYLALFLIFVFFIDTTYAVYFGRLDFVKSILFYLYNMLCVYVMRGIGEYGRLGLRRVFECNIMIQMIIYLLGIGRWHPEMRYMGTYNDPNQFGYAIFTSYCMVYCLCIKEKKRINWFYFLITAFLVYKSYSVGVMVAMVLMIVLGQYFRFATVKAENIKIYTVYLTVLTTAGAALSGVLAAWMWMPGTIIQYKVIERIHDKFAGGGSLLRNYLWDRNMLAVLDYPLYFLYGSGEGYTERFQNASNSPMNGGELHSVWVGVAYYYGIMALIVLCIWIYQNIKHSERQLVPMYIALFAEAFMLLNQRQPVFWALIVMGCYIRKGQHKRKKHTGSTKKLVSKNAIKP